MARAISACILNRGARIRTADLTDPNGARYQAAPRPEKDDQYDKSVAAMAPPPPAARSIAVMGIRHRLVAALLLLSVGVAACGGSDDTAKGNPPTATTTAAASCPSAGRHDVDGGTLVIPPAARAGAVPLLVVVIPGGGGDPRDGLGLAAAARRAGLALLYPTSRDSFWSLNHAQGDADITNVRALLARTTAGGCFDPRRLTATGVSNGAGFATRLACALPDRFAGVVPVSAGFRALDPCPATARTSLLAIHGTSDTIVPYNGKKPGREGSVPRFAARWARRVGCDATPATTAPRARVTRITYRGCDDGLRVGIVRLTGNTHGWPGAPRSPIPTAQPVPLQGDTGRRRLRTRRATPVARSRPLRPTPSRNRRVVPHRETGDQRPEGRLDAHALGVGPRPQPGAFDRGALLQQILDELR